MRFVCAALLAFALGVRPDALPQTSKPPARRPAPAPTTPPASIKEVPQMVCPAPLGVGITTKRTLCDVLAGRDPGSGALTTLAPHSRDVTVTFDLSNRHTYSEEQTKDKRAAYARYTASIGVMTMENTLISRAVVQNEFRGIGDFIDRVGGGAGPGGLKAVAPTGQE